MEPESIHFVITGGTIDSYYEPTKDTAVPLNESALPSFLSSLKLYNECEFTTVCMKDSRDLTQDDFGKIAQVVEASKHKRIIVTHGTYTMPDSAKFLNANLKRDDQTIIFTGSMIPLTGFSPSDAPFNIGFTVAKVLDTEPGIYVSMNGRLFSPEEVAKMLKEGRFISLFGEKSSR